MDASQLNVYTARFNPLRWKTPHQNFIKWVDHMLNSGVTLHVIECALGKTPFQCNVSTNPRFNFIGVRSQSTAWTKENQLNIAFQRTPEAENIMWSDSDVFYEREDWAEQVLHDIQKYVWLQPWKQCLDRGPNGEILNDGRAFYSFGYCYEQGYPLVPDRHGWKPYHHRYPHPGYSWATTRGALEYTSGLFELAGMGAGDHAMALSFVGKAISAAPRNTNPDYIEKLLLWQERALNSLKGPQHNIGYSSLVVNHRFHGSKYSRGYLPRWNMFLRNGFNPDRDLKRNSLGVLEWSGTNPELQREWILYLRKREEDGNLAGGSAQ